jgi:phospholipid transport system substrate-binding protein
MPPMTPRVAIPLGALVLACAAHLAYATASDPAVDQVQILTSALLKSMHAGPGTSMSERYRSLEPVIERVFALPLMTRLSVGPDWAKFAPDAQQVVIAAFSRYTIANYAHNFRSFGGQKFEIDANVLARGEEKIVRTRLVSPDDTPASLLYRMVQVNGVWKIIDVYYNGISQLTLHRVDFAGAVASGGSQALIDYLNKVSDGLVK